ncbi:MAG TPA: phosphoribosylglycinamide synthetase C domain-containing protein [Gemmatimonadota bacterium]|nr:phosphoribosylglycinamide synthetase C domain-containing protein [Gemmatimonadota bacterium]
MAEKTKFLFVSYDALITDIAWQVVKEGHDVRYWIREKKAKSVGEGFVSMSKDWKADAEWADVVVFDDVLGMGEDADRLRRAGKAVVGGTPYTDRLEDDRGFGQTELKAFGINIIPFEEFTSFTDAIAFVTANPARYVIKPSGEAQNIKRLLFVGEDDDGTDVIHVLESYEKVYSQRVKNFQLQRRRSGVEIAVGAFFNGHEFLSPINVNFEHKKLFPGNIGPSTGEMGTAMYWGPPNKIFNQTLAKMEKKLREERYVGYIDLNCIVNAQGIYPLEFTARFGYPTISIQQEGLNAPMGEILAALARGESIDLKPKPGFQIGVRIVVPPFPYDDPKTFEANSEDRIIIFKKPDYAGVHIEDVKLVNGGWVVTGNSGVVLIVCGTGPTMKAAQAQAYNRIKNIMIPNMYYRTDIGDRWFEDHDRLHAWGYLREI